MSGGAPDQAVASHGDGQYAVLGVADAAPAFRLPGVLQALGSSGVTGPLLL